MRRSDRTDAAIEVLNGDWASRHFPSDRDGNLYKVLRDITPDDMSIYQPHQMRKKYAVAARYQGLKEAGNLAPTTDRLRIEELAAELPQHVNDYQREGAAERVKIGKATEPTPKPAA